MKEVVHKQEQRANANKNKKVYEQNKNVKMSDQSQATKPKMQAMLTIASGAKQFWKPKAQQCLAMFLKNANSASPNLTKPTMGHNQVPADQGLTYGGLRKIAEK